MLGRSFGEYTAKRSGEDEGIVELPILSPEPQMSVSGSDIGYPLLSPPIPFLPARLSGQTTTNLSEFMRVGRTREERMVADAL